MFLNLAKSRFSCRKYLNKEVEKEKILAVLEAARIAPSAANHQPWLFYVFHTKEKLETISKVYNRQWFKESPVVIVACANHSEAWVRASDSKDHCDIDLAIAIDHITLQASDLGLATCWICNFDITACREILKLSDNIEPIALITLAYPAEKGDIERFDKARKNISEIVIWQ